MPGVGSGASGRLMISTRASSMSLSEMTAQEQTIMSLLCPRRRSLRDGGGGLHRQQRCAVRVGRQQHLLGTAHGGRKALGALHDLFDHRAAEQRERAGAHDRTGVMLAGGDHGDGYTFVAAE